ncbi:MAG: response regulator [Janthinobacterium lividum]
MPKLSCVLLVDDDPTTNFLHKLLLQQMEVAEQLLVAENGAEALHTLAQTCLQPDAAACPALILLDINMPIMNGLAFLEAYQRLEVPLLPPPVIIVLTTSMNSPELATIRQQPIAGLLSKPLTREKVAALLQQHFAHQKTIAPPD